MTQTSLVRTVFGAAASLIVIAPLAGCAGDDTLPTSPASSPQEEANDSEYADGTYTARGMYGGAPSHMDFTVTLEDGVITAVESGLMEDNNATSRGYQERFAAALPEEVVGRNVDEVEVGVLAGSSSCGDGFNDALTQIRDEARA